MVILVPQYLSVSLLAGRSGTAYKFYTISLAVSFLYSFQAKRCTLWLVWGLLLYPCVGIFCFISSLTFYKGLRRALNTCHLASLEGSLSSVRICIVSSAWVSCLISSSLGSEIGTQLAMLTNSKPLSSGSGSYVSLSFGRWLHRNSWLFWGFFQLQFWPQLWLQFCNSSSNWVCWNLLINSRCLRHAGLLYEVVLVSSKSCPSSSWTAKEVGPVDSR